jgi:hypothetical protein
VYVTVADASAGTIAAMKRTDFVSLMVEARLGMKHFWQHIPCHLGNSEPYQCLALSSRVSFGQHV